MREIFKNKFIMIGIFMLFSILLEVIMFIYIRVGIFPVYILFNISALALLSSIIFLIPSNKASLIYLSIILFIQGVFNLGNCIMYENCGDVFSMLYFKLFGEAIRVFEFDFFNIGRILLFVGIYIGYILLNVFFIKKEIFTKLEKTTYSEYLKKTIISFISIVLVFSITYSLQIAYINNDDEENVFSSSYLWSSLNLKVDGLRNFGTWGYYTREMQKLFFAPTTVEDKTIKEVNKYLSEGEYKKSEYFGLLKDNNVITIMMESFQWFAVDEYLTPNIYNLAKNNVTFSNHHSKNKTNVSEMFGITGSYPISNTLYPQSKQYDFTNSIIKYLDNEYSTTYVHPNTFKYYNRGALMPQLGFENTYFFEELYPEEELYSWGEFSLDSETMERALQYIVPDNEEKFYSFFTTLSTHGPYNNNSSNYQKLIEKGYIEKIEYAIENGLWENPLEDTAVSENFKYYKAMAMDLDAAIGMMIDKLEEQNLMDNTVIVLYGDHNAYYNEISYLIYDAVGGEYYKPYIFKTPLIICNEKLTQEYKKNNNINDQDSVNIEKFVSPYNIVPTLLDLLGHEFNSNLYLGDSVFIEENFEENNIFFSLQGGIFNDKIYTINGHDLVYTELEDYEEELELVRKASEKMLTKIKYIEYIYNYNMFNDLIIKLEDNTLIPN